MGRPPLEDPKDILTVRVQRSLLAQFKAAAPDLGRAVDEALRKWLATERRRAAKTDRLAADAAAPDDGPDRPR